MWKPVAWRCSAQQIQNDIARFLLAQTISKSLTNDAEAEASQSTILIRVSESESSESQQPTAQGSALHALPVIPLTTTRGETSLPPTHLPKTE